MTDRRESPPVDADALLCALVLAPATYARNRFFGLFENPDMRRVRRRAYHVRAILKQLLKRGPDQAIIIGRLELDDHRVLLRYKIENLKLERTTALSAIESAALNYALHRAGNAELSNQDRSRVETALSSLGSDNLIADPAQ